MKFINWRKRNTLYGVLSIPLLLFGQIPVHAEQNENSRIPDLTVIGKENEIKLEWAVDILDEDVLWKIDFNDPKEVNLMNGWGEFYGNGNQSLQSEEFYPNGRDKSGYKVFDTKLGGNSVLYPYTERVNSIAVFKRLNVPNNAYISATFKAKTRGIGRVSFYGDGSWETGRDFDFYNSHATKDHPAGSREVEITDMTPFPEKEPGSNIPRDRKHITSDLDKNKFQDSPMVDKVVPYNDGTGRGKLVLNSPIMTPIKQGDRLKVRKWAAPIVLNNNRTLTKDDFNKDANGWTTFSMNTQVANNPFYITEQRGVTFYMLVYSEDITYVDELKVGYASEAEVYRGNTQVYKGRLSDYVDKEAKDTAAPTAPRNIRFENINLKDTVVKFDNVTDEGSIYNYKIRGIGRNGTTEFSKEIPGKVTSGVKGYEYVVNDKSETSLDKESRIQFTDKNNIQFATDFTKQQYIHIRTIDKAGNRSVTVHTPITEKGKLELLSVPKETTFPTLKLNGENQVSYSKLESLKIHDSRNMSDGWRLNMSVSPFRAPNESKNLPNNSLYLNGVLNIEKTKGPKTEFPEIKMPKTAIDNGSTITLINAPKERAIGEYQIDFPENVLKLLIDPGKTYIGQDKKTSYESIITWSIVAGP
ncbi:WxL domain-containing protein (plasmid) [Bacillus thuringiensis]|uniref:WxL domain-containing protein n=1 Tax=Bacillus thuringiensis TaxID=1428 RepID=UPI002224A93D|nr:WxL domain-containing protein [Bacillus thuringiensis]UYX55670.1 WxL domain-containing protein [Bacillus thuringiensis]UYX55790.1 WxL domain-containing protein [Bacillus thuringiensis]